MVLNLISDAKICMHAIRSDYIFACEDYLFEPVIAGQRCILHAQRIAQATHAQERWPQHLPWTAADFNAYHILILDGVYDAVQKCYHTFDLIQYNHMHMSNEPLLNRKIMLQQIVRHIPRVCVVEYVLRHGRDYYEKLRGQTNCLGMIAKQLESDYLPGLQSPNWIRMDFERVSRSVSAKDGEWSAYRYDHAS